LVDGEAVADSGSAPASMLSLCLCALFAPSLSSLPMSTIFTKVWDAVSDPPLPMLSFASQESPSCCGTSMLSGVNVSTVVEPGNRSNINTVGICGIMDSWFNFSNRLSAPRTSVPVGGILRSLRHFQDGLDYASDQPDQSRAVYQSRTSPPPLGATPADLTVRDSDHTIGFAISKVPVVSLVTAPTWFGNLTSNEAVDLHPSPSRSSGASGTAEFGLTPLVELTLAAAAIPLSSQGGAVADCPDNIFFFSPVTELTLFADLTANDAVDLQPPSSWSSEAGCTASVGRQPLMELTQAVFAQTLYWCGGALANFSSTSFSAVTEPSLLADPTVDFDVDRHAPSSVSSHAECTGMCFSPTLAELTLDVSAQPLYCKGGALADWVQTSFSSVASELSETLRSDFNAIWHASSRRSYGATSLSAFGGTSVMDPALIVSAQPFSLEFFDIFEVVFGCFYLLLRVARLIWAFTAAGAASRRLMSAWSSTLSSRAALHFEIRRSSFLLQCVRNRPVMALLSPMSTAGAVFFVTWALLVQGTIYIANLAAVSIVSVSMYIFYMPTVSTHFRFLLSMASCHAVQAVTCYSCYDGIPNCAGGAACPLVTGVAANTAAFLVATGAAAIALDCSVILPIRYLRVMSLSALDCIKAVRRRPLHGTPIAIDAAAMNLDDLRAAINEGRIDRDVAIMELMARGVTAGNNLELQRIQFCITCIKASSEAAVATTRPTVALGAFTLALALASKVVSSSLSISSAVGGVVTSAATSESHTTTANSIQKAKVVWPRTMEEFSSVLNAWMVIMHATGLCDFLVASEFVRLVVYDTMEQHGHSFTVAHALLVIYLERVETTVGDDINISNVHSLGSMDMYLSRAFTLSKQCGVAQPPQPASGAKLPATDITKPAVTFNGRGTPSADKSCYTFNLGRGNVHPASSLGADGTCRFKHACDQFVSDKGPRGQCGSTSHNRKDCTNAAKVNTPAV
jgi:hypothetical protein